MLDYENVISTGLQSLAYAAPAGPDALEPLVIERSTGSWRVKADLKWAQFVRRLPRPYQQVLDVRRGEDGAELVLRRFIGLGGLEVVDALTAAGRVVPLDVWLGVAELWDGALRQFSPDHEAWRTMPDLEALGVDVRGEVVMSFDEPNHLLCHALAPPEPGSETRAGHITRIPQSIAPETVRAVEITEATRVYGLGAVLGMLLQGRRLFAPGEPVMEWLSAVAFKERKWQFERHPDVPPRLASILTRATARDPERRQATLDVLMAELREAVPVEAADESRIASVLLGASPAGVRRCFEQLAGQPEMLPVSWREGGLQVLEDRCLEQLAPLEQLPAVVW